MLHEAASRKICERCPDRHEVEWILWVAGYEIFLLEHLFKLVSSLSSEMVLCREFSATRFGAGVEKSR
jgi:hypothetical protein